MLYTIYTSRRESFRLTIDLLSLLSAVGTEKYTFKKNNLQILIHRKNKEKLLGDISVFCLVKTIF